MRSAVISTKGSRLWQGIPTIERAANGRLWCAFFSGGPKEPDPDNEILLTTSADDGVSWAEPWVAVAMPEGTRVFDPCLWHAPDGRLWLFYNRANLDTRDYTLWAQVAGASGTADLVWSAPRPIPVGVPYAFRLNKPTVLSTGAWVLPVTWARVAPEGWFGGTGQIQGVAISHDGGQTWSFHGAIETPQWALEGMIVERRDGELWMLIRTSSGAIWQSTSRDGGETWAPGTPADIVNPGSRFFVRRLTSGRLLLINTPDPKERTRLVAYLSAPDDDTRFVGGLELDGRTLVSYPDAVQAPDGWIYAVHDHDRMGLGEICLNVFAEAEVERR